MTKKELSGHIAIFSANLIYGANYSVAKYVMPTYIKAMGFVLMRVTGALLLFWLLSLFFPEKVERKDALKLFWCGIFGVAINQLMFFKGLDLTTPINASIIMITAPILVLVISSILLKDVITFQKVIGIALGIGGALILILSGKKASFGNSTALGDFFIFINAISFSIYLVLVKKLITKYSVITISKWIFLVGFVICLPFGWNEFQSIRWEEFSFNLYAAVLYVIVAVTFLAYLFNNYGLKTLNPNIVSFYIYLQPFLAALFAIYLGKDVLTLKKLISASLIFTGVYFISTKTTLITLSKND